MIDFKPLRANIPLLKTDTIDVHPHLHLLRVTNGRSHRKFSPIFPISVISKRNNQD